MLSSSPSLNELPCQTQASPSSTTCRAPPRAELHHVPSSTTCRAPLLPAPSSHVELRLFQAPPSAELLSFPHRVPAPSSTSCRSPPRAEILSFPSPSSHAELLVAELPCRAQALPSSSPSLRRAPTPSSLMPSSRAVLRLRQAPPRAELPCRAQ
ncbi:hypothetical protein Droror1_Dr00000283, partial [Drosera rotundifolia]